MKIKGLILILFLSFFSINTHSSPEWVFYHAFSQFPGYYVSGLAVDSSGYKWIYSPDSGLYKFDGYIWNKIYIPDSVFSYLKAHGIFIDKSNILWFGGNWLGKYDGINWKVFDTSNSAIPSKYIFNNIAFDNDNSKWIPTGRGLVKFDGMNWVLYDSNNSKIPNN